MMRELFTAAIACACLLLGSFADAREPFSGGSHGFSGRTPIEAPITGGPVFGGPHGFSARTPIEAPITGGPVFGGPHGFSGRTPIEAPITGGPVFGSGVQQSTGNSVRLLERPNRPFHFYGNAIRRGYNRGRTVSFR